MKNALVLFVFSSSICLSQNDFVFPFDSSCRWEYMLYSESYLPPTWVSFQLGKDTLMPNNQTYKSYAMFYFRKDGSKIYQFSEYDSSEFVRYDFSKQKGDTVSFIRHGADSSVILLADDQTISVFGQPRRVLSFHSSDYTVWDDIADSIGILYFSPVIDISYVLTGAVISGRFMAMSFRRSTKTNLCPSN